MSPFEAWLGFPIQRRQGRYLLIFYYISTTLEMWVLPHTMMKFSIITQLFYAHVWNNYEIQSPFHARTCSQKKQSFIHTSSIAFYHFSSSLSFELYARKRRIYERLWCWKNYWFSILEHSFSKVKGIPPQPSRLGPRLDKIIKLAKTNLCNKYLASTFRRRNWVPGP